MHYKKLLEAHKVYYSSGEGVWYYDEYMKEKNWHAWEKPELPVIEIMKLFGFILSWDPHFEGVLGKFKQAYEEIDPVIRSLKQEGIENINLRDEKVERNIREVFEKVANCALKFESTDASKILHTILPRLFVMWDRKIRQGLLGDRNRMYGKDYVDCFLPRMQEELDEAIGSCVLENDSPREEAIRKICKLCDDKTLPKLIDEFNWVKYTLKKEI